MEKPINVIFLPLAEEFINELDVKAKKKLFWALRKTKERIIGQWFTKLKKSDGIYEYRFMKAINTIDYLHFGTQTMKARPL